MPLYRVTIHSLVRKEDLHPEDREEILPLENSELCYRARNKDEALDEFHNEVPIAVLDHFEIGCYKISEKDPPRPVRAMSKSEEAVVAKKLGKNARKKLERRSKAAAKEASTFDLKVDSDKLLEAINDKINSLGDARVTASHGSETKLSAHGHCSSYTEPVFENHCSGSSDWLGSVTRTYSEIIDEEDDKEDEIYNYPCGICGNKYCTCTYPLTK